MAFLVTNLVQNIMRDLGQIEPVIGSFLATGGSATTFVAGTSTTGFGLLENPPETDYFKNYLAIVARDAGGAGASPEGKWSICSGYVDTTWTGTIATVTDAIAAGDKILLAKQDKFPIQNVLDAINGGLESLGDIPANANTSLTTVSNQTEYDIPVAVKRGLKQVWVQTRTGDANDNDWEQIFDKRNEFTAGGTASVLHLPQRVSGYTIKLVYDGVHPVVSAYNDVINEYIHPKVATAVCILKLLEWYNRRDDNQDPQSYFLSLEQQYRTQFLPLAMAENPIQKEMKSPKFFNRGRGNPKYSRYGPQLAE